MCRITAVTFCDAESVAWAKLRCSPATLAGENACPAECRQKVLLVPFGSSLCVRLYSGHAGELRSTSIRAVDYMVASGHSTEATRILAIALQAARWEKLVLFEALNGACEALVRMERAENLWTFFMSVEPLTRRQGLATRCETVVIGALGARH